MNLNNRLLKRFGAVALSTTLGATLMACGSSGPHVPEPEIEYTAANTLVVPEIAYGVGPEGKMLTVADDGCEVPQSIRTSLEDNLNAPYEHLVNVKPGSAPNAQTLRMEVVEILANGGGIFSGPKIVEIKGTLSGNNADVASFKARRVSFPLIGPPRSTCNLVRRATYALGSDVAGWLKRPVNGAVLGDR